MSETEILVTGGTGVLGRQVVERLRSSGEEVRVLSRGGRPGTVRGDLANGEGLGAAVDGVETIVHCASSLSKSRQSDVEGTGRLLRVARRAGVSHVVYVSIVGVDRNPYFPYYRTKLETERVVRQSTAPWTILRATQFHDFVLRLIQTFERGSFVPVPKGVILQPIDTGEVADHLIELSHGDPAGHAPDIGGPEVRTFADLARAYLGVSGEEKRVIEMPLPGKAARAFREGAQTCPDQTYGERTWEEFLEERLDPGNAQMASAYDAAR